MKKKILSICLLSGLLVSCGSSTSSSRTSSEPISQPSTSLESSSEITSSESIISSNIISTDSKNEVDGVSIDLLMYGDVYLEGIRTIYAKVNNSTSEVDWSSSNESVVKPSVREGLTSECSLIALDYGTVTITARLVDNPNVFATKVITIEEGQAMPLELFNNVTSSMKVVSEDKCLSYDNNYQETVDEHFTNTTIYEEKDVANKDYTNLTDAYHLDVYDNIRQMTTFNKSYVRGNANYLSTEYINMYNEIAYEKVLNNDDEGIKFDSSYYVNLFNNELISNESFRTFDNGKTYHYVGSYIFPSYLAASLLLIDIAPDDFYFTNVNNQLTVNIVVDPYNSRVDETTKYGRFITGNISEVGTAKIEHLQPYSHETYHDDLEYALNEIIDSKNYTVSYTMDYQTGMDYTYDFIITNDTIDQRVSSNGVTINHTGIHKNSDSTYYSYEYDESSSIITITKEYNSSWESVNRYPTFNFAPEIFDAPINNRYTTKDNNGILISRCLFLPAAVSYYTFTSPAIITLDSDLKLKSMSTELDALGENLSIDASFSNIGSTICNLDFDSAIEAIKPTSFDEENQNLAKELRGWNMYNCLPYLYAENGYEEFVYWTRDSSASNGINYTYIETNAFSSEAKRDAFITSYKALLIENGYVDTNTTEEDTGYELYEKDGFYVGVGISKSWNGSELLQAKIIVRSTKLINYYYIEY